VQFLLFAILAALSLGATWYCMFVFFAHSYRNWAASQTLVDLADSEIDHPSQVGALAAEGEVVP
jgi:hypothetical protein